MGAPNRDAIYARVAPLLHRSVDDLAPGMQGPVNRALAACQAAGLNVRVNETYRSAEVQRLYYSIGRDVLTGAVVGETVTNARTAEASFHGYKMAVDVCDAVRGYDVPDLWWSQVAEHFLNQGLAWGGTWTRKDNPHYSPSSCPASPTSEDRGDFRRGDLARVWYRYSVGPAPTIQRVDPCPTLAIGSRGDAVARLQRALQLTTVDGSFGPLTQFHVEEFQTAHNLAADGVAGRATWAALNKLTGQTNG